MSQNIDSRIVEMEFDNKQFERGVSTTIKSLDKLEQSLDLKNASRSLSNLQGTADKFDLRGMQDALFNISSRFSNLGIIGITALQNITNSAINTGKRLISSLTIDPIKTGLQEYETKMNAITTILTNTASKGTSLKDVNRVLAELNTYADQTIYNFAEMTRNIGTFTAAGVDLDLAATSIKGIANLAAGSGSSAQQASTAMYQLSQAIAAGSLKLMDWNSVVNAGMGGELFQTALKDTAKEMGVFVNESVPFRESLTDGWISTEVLTKTLAKLAEDDSLVKAATQVKTFTQLLDVMKESVQSGWAVSWEHIIGDKEESSDLLTSISEAFGSIVGPAADARNETLKMWAAYGGRESLIDGISNAIKNLLDITGSIKAGFRDIFPKSTWMDLTNLSRNFKALTEQFTASEATLDKVRRTFRGLFAVVDIGRMLFSEIADRVIDMAVSLFDFDADILGATASVGDFIVNLRDTLEASNAFGKGIDKVTDFIGGFIDSIAEAFQVTFDWIGGIKDAFLEAANIDTSGIDKFIDDLTSTMTPLTTLGNAFKVVFGGVIGIIKLFTPIAIALATGAGKAFGKLQEMISNGVSNLEADKALDVIGSGVLVGIGLGIKKFIDNISDIAGEAGGFLDSITGIFDGVRGSLEAYQSNLKAGALLKIAAAIGIMAVSLTLISGIDSAKLASSLAAMGVLFGELMVSMGVFDKFMTGGLKGMGKGVIGMIGMATAVLILVGALEKLAEIDQEKLMQGLVAIGVLSAELALFLKVADFDGMGMSAGLGLMGLAVSIKILASAVSDFGALDPNQLTQGLIGMGVVLTELAIFTKISGGQKGIVGTAIGLTILGGAMLIFAKAIENLGSMEPTTIGTGLLTMAAALGIVAAAMHLMPKGMLVQATSLVIVAAALLKIGDVINSLGGMGWTEIAKSLIVLAASLGIIAGAMFLMSKALPGAAALLVVAAALAILTPVLHSLGGMEWGEILKGLVALAGTLAIIGIAGMLLQPVVPALLGLGAAVALIGVGLALGGVGLLAFSAGLAAIAVSGAAAAGSLVIIVSSILGLIPLAFKKIGEGIIEFANVIKNGAPALTEAFRAVIMSLIDTIATMVPDIVGTLLDMLVKLGDTIIEYTPKLIKNGVTMITLLMQGIADNIGAIVELGIDIVLAFIGGISNKLPDIIDMAFKVIISFVNGLSDSIEENGPVLFDAITGLMETMVTTAFKILTTKIPEWLEKGKELIGALLDGIGDMFEKLKESMGASLDKGKEGITDGFADLWQLGADIVNGVIEGIKQKAAEFGDAFKQMGSDALEGFKNLFDIHSPSRVMKWMGDMITTGLIKGLENGTPKVEGTMRKLGDSLLAISKTWISDRRYFNELSLAEELVIWEKVQSLYKEGTEERMEADKEVWRLKKDLTAKMNKIDEDYYNGYAELKSKWEADVAAVNKTYTDAIAAREDEVYSMYSLFEKIQDPKKVSGDELTKNLKDQIETLDTWKGTLDELLAKGVSEDLVKELQDMGPKSLPELQALNSMTDTELSKYTGLWDQKHKQARRTAKTELEGMRLDTIDKIVELNLNSKTELDKLKNDWKDGMASLTVANKDELLKLRYVWDEQLRILKKDTINDFDRLGTELSEMDWPSIGVNMVQGIKKGVEKEAPALEKTIKSLGHSTVGTMRNTLEIHSPSRKFQEIGKFSIEGMINGIKAMGGSLIDTTSTAGNDVIDAMKSTMTKIRDIIDGDMDMSPVITPVLDTSQFDMDKTKFANTLDMTGLSDRAPIDPKDYRDPDPNASDGGGNTYVEFKQYNSSPKALNRLEIFRQTNNQINSAVGVI